MAKKDGKTEQLVQVVRKAYGNAVAKRSAVVVPAWVSSEARISIWCLAPQYQLP